jgi:hypothetical protein
MKNMMRMRRMNSQPDMITMKMNLRMKMGMKLQRRETVAISLPPVENDKKYAQVPEKLLWVARRAKFCTSTELIRIIFSK